MSTNWISDDEWGTIVSNVPIVSIDLLVRYDNGLLLGKRTNNPAKGFWFVPGGRVTKCETRREAVDRVAEEELGLDLRVTESLGAFEHIYNSSDIHSVEKKHYLANGYVVDVVEGDPRPDDQHAELRVFETAPEPLHPYVRAYVEKSDLISGWL